MGWILVIKLPSKILFMSFLFKFVFHGSATAITTMFIFGVTPKCRKQRFRALEIKIFPNGARPRAPLEVSTPNQSKWRCGKCIIIIIMICCLDSDAVSKNPKIYRLATTSTRLLSQKKMNFHCLVTSMISIQTVWSTAQNFWSISLCQKSKQYNHCVFCFQFKM